MKIAVLGAGAMGCLYGGYLAESDNDIYLIDIVKDHVDRINNDGLIIESADGERCFRNIKATTDPGSIGYVDILIVFVKSTLTEKAMNSVKNIINNQTIIITLQNGIGNIDKIRNVVDSNKIIAGTTSNGSTLKDLGKVYHAGKGKTTIGELDGSMTKEIIMLNELFNNVGLDTNITNNPIGLIWDKLLVNVGINALTAITGLKNGMLVMYRESEEILEESVLEAMKVAEKMNIELTIEDPIGHTKDICRLTKENTSSMLQDVLKGKKTEIDMINGAIVTYGKELGVATPINKMLTNLVKLKNQ